MNAGVKKKIKLRDREVEYELKTSRRARVMRLTVYSGGALVVTAPHFVSVGRIEEFITRKSRWVIEKIEHLSKFVGRVLTPALSGGRREYKKFKDKALALTRSRLEYFNAVYGFEFGRVTVRNQSTRWGGCSKKGNLNFNYRIVQLPSHLADYVVVHELCHLAEFNHSRSFWNLVARTIPDHKALRRELKGFGRLD